MKSRGYIDFKDINDYQELQKKTKNQYYNN